MTSSALSYDIDPVDVIQTESELSNDRNSRHLLSSGLLAIQLPFSLSRSTIGMPNPCPFPGSLKH